MGEAALDILYDGMAAADRVVAKVARLSEVAQMARAEARLRQYVEAKWNARRKQAARTAAALARKLKPAGQIARAVDKVMAKWADDVEKIYLKEFEDIYRLSRTAAWKKGLKRSTASLGFSTPKTTAIYKRKPWPMVEAVPTFDLVDAAAVEALQGQQMLWIGDHYGANVSPLIASTARETMVEAGMNRAAAAKLMEQRVGSALSMVKTPSGWNGTQREYFNGLVGNASTTARAHGQLRSFVDLGITKYEISNPVDRRTCKICSHLNGKVFTVHHGAKVVTAELGAETPDDVKKAHPWIPDTKAGLVQLKEMAPTKGKGPAKESASLAEAGFALPPFHFRCFPGFVRVWTRRGLVPIHAVQVGDEVLTHRMRWRQVTAVMNRWYEGNFVQVEGVIATEDHPFLIRRGNRAIFDAVEEGDGLATVQKSLDDLRELRDSVPRHALPYQDPPLVFQGVYEGQPGQGGPAIPSPAEGRTVQAEEANHDGLREMRQDLSLHSLPGQAVQILQSGVSEQEPDQGQMENMPGVRGEILAHSFLAPCGGRSVLVRMPREEVEEEGRPTGDRRAEGSDVGEPESDVRQDAGARQMGHGQYAVAGRDPGAEFLGGRGGAGTDRTRRAFPVRAQTLQASGGSDVSAGLLPSPPGFVDRGQGLGEGEGQTGARIVPGAADLDRSTRDEVVAFVPVRSLVSLEGSGNVWNLTIDEDESFVVEQGLVVHNCRCSVDVSTEAGSWQPAKVPTPISPTAFVAPRLPAFVPATTLAKAEAFARANVAKTVLFGDAPLAMANAVNEQLLLLQAEYGMDPLESLIFSPGWNRANAEWTEAGGRILIGTKRKISTAGLQERIRISRFLAAEHAAEGNVRKAVLHREIADGLDKVVEAIEAGAVGVHGGEHSMYAYKNTVAEQSKAVTTHEFGHLLHQKHPGKTARILQIDTTDVRTTEGISRYAVTRRAGNNLTEAVAEGLTLYEAGMASELHPNMLQLIEELKAGGRM